MLEQCEVKELKISELPDCYAKERFMQMVVSDEATIFVVAQPGDVGDWAAYIGWPSLGQIKRDYRNEETFFYTTRQRHPDGVVRFGDKLAANVAKSIFPDMARKCPRGYRP